jgi:hypothetical protein
MVNSYVTKFYRKNDKIFVPWIKKTGRGLDSFGSEQVPFARCLDKLSVSQKGLLSFPYFQTGFLNSSIYDRNKRNHYFPRSRFIKQPFFFLSLIIVYMSYWSDSERVELLYNVILYCRLVVGE